MRNLNNQGMQTIAEDLQNNLIKTNNRLKENTGLRAFERVFRQKKQIGSRLNDEKMMRKQVEQAKILVKQRVKNINLLKSTMDRQAALLQNQKEKIDIVHTVGKIKMMEKLVRLERETKALIENRQRRDRMRSQHQRISHLNYDIMMSRRQQARHGSLSHFLSSRQTSPSASECKSQIFEQNKSKASLVKAQKQRMRNKSRKIQKMKQEIARQNYVDKINKVTQEISRGQDELYGLYKVEQQSRQQCIKSSRATSQYYDSFFPTSTTI